MVSIDEFLPSSGETREYFLFLSSLNISSELCEAVPSILADSSKFYRKFRIPKRRGGLRELQSPYPSLDAIQRQVARTIFARLPVHDCAMAYQQGSKARNHAEKHVNSKELLVVDIEHFFPSISRQLILETLVDAGISIAQSHYLSLLCCVGGSLPQGASTSPILSNLVFRRLDERLSRLASVLGLVYSRYADDLAFSGESIPRNLIGLIEKIIGSKNFRLNPQKTKLKVAGAKKILTGISISSGVLKVPKSFKRKLRSEVYELEKNLSNLGAMPRLDPFVFERVLGKLNYVLHIEPNNNYAQQKKYELSISHQKMLSLGDEIFSLSLS
jgi:RNA-directed DNA polymerase